ncbi:hypothetical protein ACFP7A_13555 [Sporolactobacillus kofuensis]|uniref:DUF3919 family protein n=1 Tax=Sporolactobacillus kofuensis TaxID=269672 RepID=A0ABW1WGB9_9BACL|nr:hypothetical protein [Sporolactobacillus kofuensis]MCO7176511.1 hypothetical protein [Sporolactobacillus kofuensis]
MRLRKDKLISLLLVLATALITLVILPLFLSVRPSITYFPAHERLHYLYAKTNLSINNDDQTFKWVVASQTAEKNNLMQDFSLLYRDNRLVSVNNNWQKNVAQLYSEKFLPLSPGHYISLTVHQAELHIGESIYGKEVLSQDYLFVTRKNGAFTGFREPITTQQATLLSTTSLKTEMARAALLHKASQQYGIQLDHYHIVPLDALTSKSITRLFPFDEKKAERITGQLWEGLYKAYIRGIQITSEQGQPGIGSSMPLLLIASDHMLIIIENADHQIVLLKQNFS